MPVELEVNDTPPNVGAKYPVVGVYIATLKKKAYLEQEAGIVMEFVQVWPEN